MAILTVDFESYYSQTYSLSKMTTELYIRSPDFEVIGVCVKVDNGNPLWFSGPRIAVKKFLDQFDWGNSVAVAHNAMFDMAILNWHFGIRPKRIVDTLSMARALGHPSVSLATLAREYGLGEKGSEVTAALGKRRLDFSPDDLERYGAYCANDTQLTYDLFLKLAEGFPLDELKLIDLTIRMFTEPALVLDADVLTGHLQDVQAKKAELMSSLSVDRSVLMSNLRFVHLLMHLGVDPPTKISPTTGEETYAFSKNDEAFIALTEHENPAVQALVAARMGVKSTIEETRTERFIGIANRGMLPVPLRYYAAHTGRWGGDDKLNMQNLPRKSPLKKAICAPEGYVILDSDSSQIEARTLAWLAEQEDLVQAFERGEDVYRLMASAIYNKDPEDVTKDERFVGKTTVLGCGYGMGHKKFRAQLKNFGVDLPAEECERIIYVYRETYPRIPMLWKSANNSLSAILGNVSTPLGRDEVLAVEGEEGIRLPNGLYLRYPNLRWVEVNPGEKPQFVYDTRKGRSIVPNRIYGGKVVENVCQALARIVIGNQMLQVAKRYRVVMTVHDAIGCIVPEREADAAKVFIETCMRSRPDWAPDLPLNCEAGYGPNYGECK